jgi:hypothetical protein
MSPASIARALGADAALVTPVTDPPAAAGDLKSEIEKFTTLDACVAEHAQTDPLVGDALDAIGYDTFLRDACRILEAMKAKDPRRCAPIESTSLRVRCESFVAMAGGHPEACPFDVPSDPQRGREPTCVAVASRDARLCAAEARPKRASCEALASKDDKRCVTSPGPAEKKACERAVLRWRGTIGDALAAAPGAAPRPVGRIEVRGVDGTPDPRPPITDLASEIDQGVVLVREPLGGLRLRVGSLLASGVVPHAVGALKTTRIGVELVLPKEVAGEARIERVELEIPGAVELTTPSLRTLKATVLELEATRGGKLRIVIDGAAPTTVDDPPRIYRVHVELTTFVRDITGTAREGTAPTPAP